MSSRLSKKIQISSLPLRDGSNEGTAARTRPFSYYEIMLRRKNKKQPGGEVHNHFEVEIGTSKISHDSIPDKSEKGRSRHTNTTTVTSLLSSGEFKKFRSRVADKVSIKDDIDKSLRSRSKDPEGLNDIMKTKPSKHTIKIGKKSGIIDEHVPVIRNRKKIEEWSGEDYDSEREYKRKKLKDTIRSFRQLEGSDHKFKSDKRLSQKTLKPRSKEVHDHGRWHSTFSTKKERKESSPFSYHEEPILRRRSRSPIFGKGKNRRSVSPSGSHKRASYRDREHVPHHKLKEPVGGKDYDESKCSTYSNGSHINHKRHGTFTGSRLGGYSPRKRRSEIAARTPSPVSRSPVKKIEDPSPPTPVSDKLASSVELADGTDRTIASEAEKGFSSFPTSETNVGFSAVTLIPPQSPSIDSVQLTQATRPMRRLHIENLVASVSEKALTEFLNNYLLGSGSNHIHGIWPCISCNIHRERGHAFVEFLTPEDASMALSLDGKPFSGSFLRVKRPKDFVEVATGSVDQIPSVAVAINSTVKDSSNKIFIGGISEVLSSDMVVEIVSTFGLLKAFSFQPKDDHIKFHRAFLEYLDPSVTLKACSGLGGLKLGGKVLTVVPVFPDTSTLKVDGEAEPFYGIPEHAKPLLEKPTRVLKLTNVFDLELLLLMEEAEVEEVLEDLRLECARFGSVKSVSIIRYNESIPSAHHVPDKDDLLPIPPDGQTEEQLNQDTKGNVETVGLEDSDDPPVKDDTCPVITVTRPDDDPLVRDNTCPVITVTRPDDDPPVKEDTCPVITETRPDDDPPVRDDTSPIITETRPDDDPPVKEDTCPIITETRPDEYGCAVEEEVAVEKGEEVEECVGVAKVGDVCDSICVLVEFKREEASCVAAHSLHGRLFDRRRVYVSYVSPDLLRAAVSWSVKPRLEVGAEVIEPGFNSTNPGGVHGSSGSIGECSPSVASSSAVL